MNRGACVIGLVVAFNLGCQRDKPQPLTPEVVQEALSQPNNTAIRDRMRALHHPLLHAVNLDIDAGITPDDAAVIAVVASPGLVAERAKPALADARVLQATILPNPVLNISLDQPIGSNSSGEVTGYGLGLDWEITSLIAHDSKVKAARASAEQVRLDLLWKEWQVAEAAKQAAFDVLALRRQREVTQQLAEELSEIAEQAKRALTSHNETATDASAAQAAADDARVSLAETDRDLEDAKLVLNASIGFAPHAEIRVIELAVPATLPDIKSLVTNIDQRRVDLVALRRGYESQEAAVRSAILGQFPKIGVGISNTRDYGNFLTLGPTATADLPLFDRNQGNIAAEKATREQLKREFLARVFEARSDITRASTLIGTLDKVIAAKSAEVDSLKAYVGHSRDALKNGSIEINAFYAAAVNLNQKQIELIKAQQDRSHALVALELAAGVNLSRSTPTTERVSR